jgi:hypothetical protein
LEGSQKLGMILKAWKKDLERLEGFQKVGRVSKGWKASK